VIFLSTFAQGKIDGLSPISIEIKNLHVENISEEEMSKKYKTEQKKRYSCDLTVNFGDKKFNFPRDFYFFNSFSKMTPSSISKTDPMANFFQGNYLFLQLDFIDEKHRSKYGYSSLILLNHVITTCTGYTCTTMKKSYYKFLTTKRGEAYMMKWENLVEIAKIKLDSLNALSTFINNNFSTMSLLKKFFGMSIEDQSKIAREIPTSLERFLPE